ncbi:hypothetical protein I553_3833 [Mycobacterium xenopi 4042]|uniref:Uncharacterized protein n=1 Tax=Mycobacterium xenopi 4042 TaxID=1299334 RepID=X7YSN3_MYCXE|nr:hypothetical protein I553_3833 [Mycobacterium xenopi 4042]
MLGDPRLGITGIFLSLSRVLPTAIPWVSTSHRSSRRNTVSGTWPCCRVWDAQGFAVADAGGHRDPVEDLHDEPRRLEVDDEVRV